jgi:hypothetical protein
MDRARRSIGASVNRETNDGEEAMTIETLERDLGLDSQQVEALQDAVRRNGEPLDRILKDAVEDYLAYRAQIIAIARARLRAAVQVQS